MSQTFRELTNALAAAQNKRGPIFLPFLERPFAATVNFLGEPQRSRRPRRLADESVHALSGLEHGVRQHSRDSGTGPQAGAVFAIQLSAAEVQPRDQLHLPLPDWPHAAAEGPPHDGLDPRSLGQQQHRSRQSCGWMLGKGKPWQPGEKLKLLFAGYNGTRNMGSDVRVEKCCGRSGTFWAPKTSAFSVMTQNFELTEGYFEGTSQVHLPDIFPPFLSDEVPKHHGVVACEGSMFKSKFANALTTMMIGSLGIAAAQNKLSVGYGAEAGHMDPADREDVRALLPEFAGDHAQRRIADRAARTGRAHRVGHRHGVDLRAAPRRVWPERLCGKSAGTAARRCWWCVRSIPSSGR